MGRTRGHGGDTYVPRKKIILSSISVKQLLPEKKITETSCCSTPAYRREKAHFFVKESQEHAASQNWALFYPTYLSVSPESKTKSGLGGPELFSLFLPNNLWDNSSNQHS